MVKACVYVPAKGKDTFRKLKRDLGYKQASVVFDKITGSDFLRIYGDKVSLDSEGVPTYESIIELPIVRDYIGIKTRVNAAQKAFTPMEDTFANASVLIEKANEFNKSSKEMVAIVDYTEDGKIQIKVEEATEESRQMALDQYRMQKLNEKMSELLRPAGITFQMLSSRESAVGRVGHTQFVKVQNMANEFTVLLEAANNLEGVHAVSEEFAHYIIGILNGEPLVARSIEYFKNVDNARAVLGEQFDTVFSYYNGNMDLVAEEAAGHVFQQSLLKQTDSATQVPLLKRMVNYVLNLFKNISPKTYQNEIDSIVKQYDELARQIVSGERKVTKKDINAAKRIADFNALSEKVAAQLDALKEFITREYKAAALMDNIDEKGKYDRTEKSKARQRAEDLNTDMQEHIKKGESMAAIATYLTSALQEVNELKSKITDLENMTAKDRFTILRNALQTILKYKDTIKELQQITEPSFLNDEEIAKQSFVIEDSAESLADFEVSSDVETLDTLGKTAEEVVSMIASESEKFVLSDDESSYINTETGQQSARVTTVIEADLEGHKFDPNSPWKTPATNIGTGMDELTRDFVSGRITKLASGDYVVNGVPVEEVYPNASKAQLTHFISELEEFKADLTRKGITLVSRDVTVNGTIKTTDGTGREHLVSVAGTLDLLGYDAEGNWYIYDMKTHRSENISEESMKKYRRQLTLYKKFLEQRYSITVKELNVLPIKVSYPTPLGFKNGTAKYEVSTEESSPEYRGRANNQLVVDGEPFKKAYPKLESVIPIEDLESDIQYAKLANDPTNGLGGGVDLILKAIANMSDVYSRFEGQFYEQALPYFVEFLKPIIGDNISVADPDNPGKFKTISVEKLIKQGDADTTLMQRWLSSMADNPDALLQIFDKVVKIAKDEKRIRTIEKAQEIIALGRKYEGRGVTSYEWMYEDNKMHYINKLYDESAYLKAKATKIKELDALYGKHPVIGTEEYKKKNAALQQWVKENTELSPESQDTFIPKRSLYPSKYESLPQVKKDFYDEWMAIKQELDAIVGPKTFLTNSIKIRKSNIERLHSVTDGTAIQSFVDGVRSKAQKSFDDGYSRKDKKSIKNFDGNEFMKLPLYYIYADEKDAQDISVDAIGTLVAYADMVYGYDAMNQIVNPLEVGRELVRHRKIAERRNGLPLRESFKTKNDTHTEPIYVNTQESNFMALLNEFFESKIYGRYLKDYDDIAGIDKNKAASALLKLGSTVQLGFNVMANVANVLTGIAMQNIEAAAGEFFKARELAMADKEFSAAMIDFVGDLGKRAKESKLALFDELFDVRQDFSGNIKHKDFLNKNLLTRIFGPGIQYIGQDAGDHWLYNRTAIALALRYKLIDTNNGNKEISLWDALQVAPVDKNNPKAGNKLIIKPGVKKADGSEFSTRDISDLSGRMRYVNQHLFGIYNQEDAVAARRTITGRFLMQYRDWIPTQIRYRFGAATTNLEKGEGEKVEGYYRTMWRFSKQIYTELKDSDKTIPQVWNSLEDYEKANIKRALFEVLQFSIVSLMCSLLGKSKDKDRPWILKMLRYALMREKTELGALVPGHPMVLEGIKILKSPMAATNIMENTAGLAELFWIPNYFDEIETGDYKGHSTAYKAFFKSPLSLWYKTFKRIEDPDKASTYFK